MDSSGSGQILVAGCCESGNGPLSSIKGGRFLDKLSDSFSRRTVLYRLSSVLLHQKEWSGYVGSGGGGSKRATLWPVDTQIAKCKFQ
jgi:hypothetical protein